MRIRQLNHSCYQLLYHLVWATKYRRKFIKSYVHSELIKSLRAFSRRYPEWRIDKVNTGPDHVHLLIEIPPKDAVSVVVQRLKSETSAKLRKRFPFIDKLYNHSGLWSVGYFVSSVGLNEDTIRKYIARQNKYDSGADISSEFS